jgi:DinB superfamily
MPIVPDDKNWTWVLHRTCLDCGFDGPGVEAADVAALVRANAAQWPELLNDPQVRLRPTGDLWSALEYGCHVRDVFRLYAVRVRLMLDQDAPRFANWDQDATAVEDQYGIQDPSVVAGEVVEAGAALAALFESVTAGQWQRSGYRSDGAEFTIDTIARYMVHDPIHHVDDVRRGYEILAAGVLDG